ncbi:LPXTG cell wall anchor domain-containing protein, partial [Listeria monocytogenes]|nr:LPXTG cell wall anchor domain-containing protein [Listeria monocytogenes]
YSEEATYIYVGEIIDNPVVNPDTPVVTPVKPTVKPNPVVKSDSIENPTPKAHSTHTSKKSLPKTGDESSLPLAAIGILLAGGALVVLRKRHA